MRLLQVCVVAVIVPVVASFARHDFGWVASSPASAQSRPAPAADVTKRAMSAAQAYLATLDAGARAKALLPLTSELRSRWSNLPTGISMQVDQNRQGGPFPRNGLSFGNLTPAQQAAALALVGSTLSRAGYQKILDILQADQVLEETSAPTRAAASAVRFGRAQYYVAILGTPSATETWILQFGGHHLALNVTMMGSRHVITPTHTGAQPTTYVFEQRTVRPLGGELDKGLALMNALTPAQQKDATLEAKFADMVLGPGEDGRTLQPEGVRAAGFNALQQQLLLDLAGEWVGIVNDAEAATRMADVKTNLSQTYFAWSGPVTRAGAAYFRVQGPTVHIEYAPQAGRGADGLPSHIHTIYRDPSNDYGLKVSGR
jgi:guanyl-specific ribonuclease Sa